MCILTFLFFVLKVAELMYYILLFMLIMNFLVIVRKMILDLRDIYEKIQSLLWNLLICFHVILI